MKKALALILALLTILPVLAACQNNPTESPTTTVAPSADPSETEADDFNDNVPELDFEEHEFVFAAPWPSEWGVMSYDREEDSGDTIESAIYARNGMIEERFNITISAIELGNTGNQAAAFQQYAVSGEDIIDVIAVGYYQSGKPLITSDYVLPWNDVEYINLDRDWWNKSITKTLAILDNYYYISGDVNWFTMQEIPVCYFNKEVQKDQYANVGDLYQMVKDHEWTLENCYNIAKSIANDSTGDGVYDENDTYGAIQNIIIGTTGFLYGTGYQTVYSTDEGPVMNIRTEKLKNIMEWIVGFCNENNISFTERFDFTADSRGIPIFFDNRALFYFDVLMHAQSFRDEESDFGIIPYPLYDTNQKKYTSYSNQWGLACALPATATDTSRTGAILEAICALSRKEIVPAYYELTLMGKIKRDDESEEMLDIIFANVLYDFGICYCTNTKYIMGETLVIQNNKNVTSWYESNKKAMYTNYWELYKHVYEKINGEGTCPEMPNI